MEKKNKQVLLKYDTYFFGFFPRRPLFFSSFSKIVNNVLRKYKLSSAKAPYFSVCQRTHNHFLFCPIPNWIKYCLIYFFRI